MKKTFILLAGFSGALLCLLSGKLFPFTFDSFIYISTAENIHRWQGLMCANFFVQGSMKDCIPNFFQPPGYSILISLLMLFGFDGNAAGLLVPRVCFLLLPFLFYSIFKRLMPSFQAMIAAFICVFMFPVVKCALFAWSDIPCLCFTLMALLAVFYVIEKGQKASSYLILLVGVLAGYVFLIRFVGICLIASIGVGFIISWLFKVVSKNDLFKIGSLYILGIALVIVPFLYRNWFVFGTIQPFAFHLRDISFLSKASMISVMSFLIIAIIGTLLVIKSKKLIKEDKKAFVFMAILTAYFLIYSIFMTIFQALWFPYIRMDDRYWIQVAWIVMILIAAGLKQKHMVAALLSLFIIVQVVLAKYFLTAQEQTLAISKSIQHDVQILRKVPSDFMIITNLPEMVNYHIQRNIRILNSYTPDDLLRIISPYRKFVVLLIKGGQNPQGYWGAYNLQWDHPQGYVKIFSDRQIDLFIPR